MDGFSLFSTRGDLIYGQSLKQETRYHPTDDGTESETMIMDKRIQYWIRDSEKNLNGTESETGTQIWPRRYRIRDQTWVEPRFLDGTGIPADLCCKVESSFES